MDEDEMGGPSWGMGRGMGWRIALSILAFLGLIIFIVVWLFFFARRLQRLPEHRDSHRVLPRILRNRGGRMGDHVDEMGPALVIGDG